MTPQPAAPLRMSEIRAGDTHVCGDTSSMYRLVCEPLAAIVAKQNPTLSDEQLCAMRLGAPLSRWPATARANVEHVDEMHPGLIDQTADAAYHKVHEYLSREFPGLAAAARQALSIASADLARHLTLALCTSPSGGDASPPHRRRRTVAPPEATSDLAADLATAPKASLSRCFTSAAPKEAKGGAAPAVFVAMHAGSAPESAAILAHIILRV